MSENITIELYYCKDEVGNTIIDREFMIKDMDKKIASIVEGAVIEVPLSDVREWTPKAKAWRKDMRRLNEI